MIVMSIWRSGPARSCLALVAVGALVAGCASDGAGTAKSADKLNVAAAFYPLAFVTERIGGDRVTVRLVTKPGVEPHDVELTPRDVAGIVDADLVVYLSGFQPQVDGAVAKAKADRRIDVADSAKLERVAGVADPHFWLDPVRLADVVTAVADRLAARDPAGKSAFAAGAATLRKDLDRLNVDYQNGTKGCSGSAFITTHTAFGYLARRYQLIQVGIAGIDPEAEPTAADQAAAVDVARKHGIKTIFKEPLVSDSIANTVAAEIGGKTAVLDPLEGINKDSLGKDYLEVMRSNIDALRSGLVCR